MKTYLAGVVTGLLIAAAYKYRATLFPWLRTETEKVVDALAKKKD